MKDSISNRIGRIIAGTANSIVSKIEGLSSAAVHENAISKIDEALDDVKAELGSITVQKYHVSKSMTRLNTEHSSLEEQVLAAYKDGRKDVVESGLARQTDIEDQLPALEGQLRRLSAQESDLNQAVTGLIAKRNEMEDELQEFLENGDSDADTIGDEPLYESNSALLKAQKAELNYSRIIQRTTGINRSALTSNSRESAKLVELANLSRNTKIEAKLKELEERVLLEGEL